MKIMGKLGNQKILYISDGKHNLAFKEGFFKHSITASRTAVIKEFYVFLDEALDTEKSAELLRLNYKIIDLN